MSKKTERNYKHHEERISQKERETKRKKNLSIPHAYDLKGE